MSVFITQNGGNLNPGFDGTGGPISTANAKARKVSLSSSLGDAFAAQVSYGWDQVSGSCRIVLPVLSAGLGETFSISMGAGNNQQRFSGTLKQFDTMVSPHVVTAVGKGPLAALEEYKLGEISQDQNDDTNKNGLAFEDLLGSSTATLQQIVSAVLGRTGVGSGDLDDPPHIYGLDGLGKPTYNDALVWGVNETAASYLHRFLEASAGYRLFDSSDGGIYMRQITAIPGNSPGTPGTADASFTLGEDIEAQSTSSLSILGQQTAVLVMGWDDGSGPATSGVVGPGSAFTISSNLIESDEFAVEIANYWLPLVNRPQFIVRLVTPRDDLIGPGCTVAINGVAADNMWVKSCTAEVSAGGAFSQTLVCVASNG